MPIVKRMMEVSVSICDGCGAESIGAFNLGSVSMVKQPDGTIVEKVWCRECAEKREEKRMRSNRK